jgi:hypothetical protein
MLGGNEVSTRYNYPNPCPRCGATQGNPCRAQPSGKITDTHAARMKGNYTAPIELQKEVTVGQRIGAIERPAAGPLPERVSLAGDPGPLPPLPDSAYPPGSKALAVEPSSPYPLGGETRPWWWPFSKLAPIGSSWTKENP